MYLLRGRSTPAIRAIIDSLYPVFRGPRRAPLLRLVGWSLSLPLLVLRVFADHANHTMAANDLALVTNFLNRCPNLHLNYSNLLICIDKRFFHASGRTAKAPPRPCPREGYE